MKLWGGRFEKETEALVHAFSSSLPYDRRLAPHDLRVSAAHAQALEECGVISAAEREAILAALGELRAEMERGDFAYADEEDIHTAVERALVERLGESGAKLRAGRSRNDQVAADMRLFVKEECRRITGLLLELMEVVLERAREQLGVVMPGFTHLQPAQPVLLSHHLMAYFEMFKRDAERLAEAGARADVCPLGSGALAGVTFPLDRGMMADELGFGGISANSLDAVSDRDFVADLLYALCMLAVHLSRMAEEMVLWSTPRFGFMVLDEAYATGSSIMPQKANPDLAELVRGKTGRMLGHLASLLVVLKGLPLAYNRDLQEDKEALFDAVDQAAAMLRVMTGALATASFDAAAMAGAAMEGYTNATDLADYLVRRGLPFLEAHAAAGKLVRVCLESGKRLEDLELEEFRAVEPRVGEDVYDHLSVKACVESRDLPGGTATARVEEAMAAAAEWLEARRMRP
ncbi:MAG: argininosuccinate lyase [Actinomycetota bacterium]|nr:argininosuccinate lyase [Actinomycetota bacterium]